MRRLSPAYRLFAILSVAAVIAGTQGFVVSSHTCSTCGTHEEHISLFGSVAGTGHSCETESFAAGACCAAPEPAVDTGTSGTCQSCPELNGEPCCSYEAERLVMEPFSQEKSSRTVMVFPPVATETVLPGMLPAATVFSHSASHNRHQCSSPEILRRNCCMLL
ncbi:MAG: hypothetical protein FJY11_03705 [Bacteroidetes bacterium]|nr:hypothetical protein [Bacteroidota bacterium]